MKRYTGRIMQFSSPAALFLALTASPPTHGVKVIVSYSLTNAAMVQYSETISTINANLYPAEWRALFSEVNKDTAKGGGGKRMQHLLWDFKT